jgi:hypothetical protein
MTTGSWIVKREDRHGMAYLIGGPFAPDSIRMWLAWSGNAPDAYVFSTKTAARKALVGHGLRGLIIERSYGHEAGKGTTE